MKDLTYHEANKEFKSAKLSERHESRTVPEDERNRKEDHRLLEKISEIRQAKGCLQPTEMAYRPLLKMADLFDFLKGSSKLLLYRSQQSFSRVKAATVRMDAAASQASCAEAACSFLLA